MKKTTTFFIALLLSLLISCGKEKPPATGPAAVLYSIRDASSLDELLENYSHDTVSVVRDLIREKTLSREQAEAVLSVVDKGTSFEVASEQKNEKSSEVTILITEHRIENRVGTRMDLTLLLEEGKWVVDMEEALKKTGKAYRQSSTGDYLNRKLRSYQ